MASSSAIQLADLALIWSTAQDSADMALIDNDLASDRGLDTAYALSLFCDRRAEPDDVPPSGDPKDRRGWWADEFAEVKGDRYGSRLWLLYRSKLTNETGLKAKEYAVEALAWAVEDKVVERNDVTVEVTKNGLSFAVEARRPGRDPVTFRFAHVWDHIEEDT